MDFLTWQLVVVIIGGITAFLSFLYAMLNNKKAPEPQKFNIGVIQEQIKNLRSDLINMKHEITSNEARNKEVFDKFENKIDKLTDIIIEHIRRDD